MRAILEFNLPEDRYEYKNAAKGTKYLMALEDIYTTLRNKVKYAEKTEAEDKVYNEIYDYFFEVLKENDITLFEE